MDPVDQLQFASMLATMMRACHQPRTVLDEARRMIGQQPLAEDDGRELSQVVLQLVIDATESGHDRVDLFGEVSDLIQRLGTSGPLLNRPADGWKEPENAVPVEPAIDEEAEQLVRALREAETEGQDMMGELPPFGLADRSVWAHFGGGVVVVRNGERLSEEQAGELQPGDEVVPVSGDLPQSVWGLIDYPLRHPVRFRIETGEAPWSVWEILQAFADQYVRIYLEPRKHGVWGHDLGDLVVEGLGWYPEHQLIYPFVGS